MQPPRALWVSFPLGRPLGKPGDAVFQNKVINAALELLHRPAGPVLEDFPEDAPVVDLEESAPVCPVSFSSIESELDTWEARLLADLAAVKPWHDLSRRRRGRSLVGVSDRTPDENIAAIGRLLDEDALPLDDLKWFKHAVEDLKVLYIEAFTAQPGSYDHEAVHEIFWRDSTLGAALIQFYHLFQESGHDIIARIIVPREAVGESNN